DREAVGALELAHQARLGERRQVQVDGGEAELLPALPQVHVEALGADVPVLLEEVAEDYLARAAVAEAVLLQHPAGLGGLGARPFGRRPCLLGLRARRCRWFAAVHPVMPLRPGRP